jgi:hypothetical protein
MLSEKKKVQKYCRIFNWIQDNDEEFADVMVNLCVDRIADTTKKIPSITFLMPKGKLRTQIIDLAYSNTPEKAVDMIISLVIPYGFATVESFNNANATQIGNKLRYLFPKIVKQNSKNVSFGDKLVIKPNNSLVPRDNNKIYLWDIEAGEPPNNLNKYVEKQEYIIPDGSRQIKGRAECSSDPLLELNGKPRAIFAQQIEQLVRDEIQKIHSKNPYLIAVIHLLNKLLEKPHYSLFIKIKPILDVDPIITFYMILEPYKLVGEYIISDDIFNQRFFNAILKSRNTIVDPANEYRNILNKVVEDNSNVFTNTKGIIDIVNDIRNRLLNETEARLLPEEVLNIYNTFEEKNEIKSYSNKSVLTKILPESLVAHYQNNHNKRLWQDEYRFIIGECLRTMKTEPDAVTRGIIFNTLCNTLKTTLRGDYYSDELCIMNTSDYALTTCIRDRIRIMQYFVNSPDFLYIGCNLELICGTTGSIAEVQGVNRHIIAEKELPKIAKQTDPSDLENIISNLPEQIRTDFLLKMEKYKKKENEAKKEIKGSEHEEYQYNDESSNEDNITN